MVINARSLLCPNRPTAVNGPPSSADGRDRSGTGGSTSLGARRHSCVQRHAGGARRRCSRRSPPGQLRLVVRCPLAGGRECDHPIGVGLRTGNSVQNQVDACAHVVVRNVNRPAGVTPQLGPDQVAGYTHVASRAGHPCLRLHYESNFPRLPELGPDQVVGCRPARVEILRASSGPGAIPPKRSCRGCLSRSGT
jgi:hypothetical protein